MRRTGRDQAGPLERAEHDRDGGSLHAEPRRQKLVLRHHRQQRQCDPLVGAGRQHHLAAEQLADDAGDGAGPAEAPERPAPAVLVVDDHDDSRAIMALVLRECVTCPRGLHVAAVGRLQVARPILEKPALPDVLLATVQRFAKA